MEQQVSLPSKGIPSGIRKMLVKAVFLFTAWMLCYNLWLKPMGIPDIYFTRVVTSGTEQVLHFFYQDIRETESSIFINGVRSVNIANPCNGLELTALLIGVLICLPGSFKKKFLFSLGGTAGIILLNIIRCALLAWMFYGKMPLADFAHHYAFKLVIYLFTFACWVLFCKNLSFNGKN